MLTPEEKARNTWGCALRFMYNPDLDLLYKSPMPDVFPDLIHCRCLMTQYELPSLDGLPYRVGLLPGAKVGIHALAGFPSLHTLPYRGHLEQAGVTVFQQASKNDSMVITLQNLFEGQKTESLAHSKIGKKIFFGWPYLREGKVVAVSDNLFRYEVVSVGSTSKVVPIAHGPGQLVEFERDSNRIEENYSKRFGVVTGEVEVLVHVAPLKGLRRTDEGAMVKDYAEGSPAAEITQAVQTTVAEVHSEDVRYIEKAPVPIEEEFPVESIAFFLGEFNYGRPLRVMGHQGNKLDIQVLTLKHKESVLFAREIVHKSEKDKPYFPSYTVATLVGMRPLPLSKITSSFTVVSGETRLNLGLSLKFEARRQKILGYTRRVPEGWQFSNKALALIREYKTKFPEFIIALDRNPHKGTPLHYVVNLDFYEPQDFYPAAIADEKIAEIDKWLKSTEPRKLDRVPIEADQLDADVVQKIEAAAAELPSNHADPYKPARISGVPRQAVLHPSHAEARLQGQHFTVGDRVVYVQNSGKVEIAMRGTVVGINSSTLDVVFDTPIMSGSTLGGRCTEGRGSIVPKSSVLNLTHPTVIALSKAALLRKSTDEESSQTSSPAPPRGRGRGRGAGGRWYTPWDVIPGTPPRNTNGATSRTPASFTANLPAMLVRDPESGEQRVRGGHVHQYRNGVAIPPPANLDRRTRLNGRAGGRGGTAVRGASVRGGAAVRGVSSERGGLPTRSAPPGNRGGAPVNRGVSGARRGRSRGRGRGNVAQGDAQSLT
jgi:5'-3' exoribonuclease 1